MINESIDMTFAKIDNLPLWGENWNSYQVPAPNPKAVQYAKCWIICFYRLMKDLEVSWISPAVAGGDNGEVALEWWNDNKKLTIYISDESIEYVQVSGDTSTTEITDGVIKSLRDATLLFLWLVESTKGV